MQITDSCSILVHDDDREREAIPSSSISAVSESEVSIHVAVSPVIF